jgi:HSF-type DNA-binding
MGRKAKMPGNMDGAAEEEEEVVTSSSSSSSTAVARNLNDQETTWQGAADHADVMLAAVAMANAATAAPSAFANSSTQNIANTSDTHPETLQEEELPFSQHNSPKANPESRSTEESKKEDDDTRKMPAIMMQSSSSPLVTPPFGSNAAPPGSPPPSTSQHNFTVGPEPPLPPAPPSPRSVPTATTVTASSSTTTIPITTTAPRRQRLKLPPPIHADTNTAATATATALREAAPQQQQKQQQSSSPPTSPPAARRGIPHVYHDYANVSSSLSGQQHPAGSGIGPGGGAGAATYIRKKTGGVTQPFPEKLHEMLMAETTAASTGRPDVDVNTAASSIVSWLPHGRGFIVRRPKEFATEIMPKYVVVMCEVV